MLALIFFDILSGAFARAGLQRGHVDQCLMEIGMEGVTRRKKPTYGPEGIPITRNSRAQEAEPR